MAWRCRRAWGLTRGSRGAGHWQRPAHGLLGRRPDHAPGGTHGAARHAGQYPADGGDPRLVEGLVQVNALGRFPVKGLPEPVEVFELVGASTIRGRLQASAARGLTRFVGRQQELGACSRRWNRRGRGMASSRTVGEAGVGKSRLVYEFVHSHTPRAGWSSKALGVVWQGDAVLPGYRLLKRYCHVDDTTTRALSAPR